MTAISLRLPYPPSANRYWRVFRGRAVPSSAAVAYKEGVAWIARQAGMRRPLADAVQITMTLHPVTPKDAAKRERQQGPLWHRSLRCIDLDNAIKVTLDALNGVAFVDDSQVVVLVVDRGLPIEGGGVTLGVGPA